MLDIGHHHSLEEIAEYGVTQNRTARFNFEPATPSLMISVDLIPQSGFAVLTIKHGPRNLSPASLSQLDCKA